MCGHHRQSKFATVVTSMQATIKRDLGMRMISICALRIDVIALKTPPPSYETLSESACASFRGSKLGSFSS